MMKPIRTDDFRGRALKLGLHGLVARWEEVAGESWIEPLVETEEKERDNRSLARRIKNAKIGRFKPMSDFDWDWPKKIDREQIEELFTFEFLEKDFANVILVGPNGVAKTMIGQNLSYQAILRGHTVLKTTASELLNDLAAQDSSSSLERRLRKYTHPRLLFIDELGYLSYDSRHADLLFEVVTRRYEEKSTIVTTNRAFKEWHETFPNASCVVTLIDRLIHRSEIVRIDGESYRLKEAKEREAARAKARAARKQAKNQRWREGKNAGRS
jgi:DNA replication protein DnaC